MALIRAMKAGDVISVGDYQIKFCFKDYDEAVFRIKYLDGKIEEIEVGPEAWFDLKRKVFVDFEDRDKESIYIGLIDDRGGRVNATTGIEAPKSIKIDFEEF